MENSFKKKVILFFMSHYKLRNSFFCMMILSCAAVFTACGYYEKEATPAFYGLMRSAFSANTVYRAFAFDNARGEIYAANENARRVDVLDSNGNLLRQLDGSESTKGTYKNISDLCIANGRLFVASHQNNRVDIYSLPASDSTFKEMLGRGGTWGDARNPGGLLHPQALAANDKYVFVAVYNGDIVVYDIDAVMTSTSQYAPKYCYLKMDSGTPSNNMNSISYLTIITENNVSKLYATADNFETLYIFNIDSLQAGNTYPAQQKLTSAQMGNLRLHGISANQNFVAIAQASNANNRRIAFYKKADFLAQKFSSPVAVFSDFFGEKFPTDPKHIYLNGDNLFATTISYSQNNENFTASGKTFAAGWRIYEIVEY